MDPDVQAALEASYIELLQSHNNGEGSSSSNVIAVDKNRPQSLGNVNDLLRAIALRTAKAELPLETSASPLSQEQQERLNDEYLKSKSTRKRLVARHWPRNPNGPAITPENSCLGKMAPNGIQFWGATLLDFYYVYRIPECQSLISLSTGSKLAAWMKKQNELKWADYELQCAEREESPKQIHPFPIKELILEQERALISNMTSEPRGTRVYEEWPPEDIYAPSAYPAPWPLEPFSDPNIPTLQERLPYNMLPQKLLVHDPYQLLRASTHLDNGSDNENDYEDESTDQGEPNESGDKDGKGSKLWSKKPDIVHHYRLKLTEQGLNHCKNGRLNSHKEYDEKYIPAYNESLKRTVAFGYLLDPLEDMEQGPCKPLIYVLQDPPPPPPTEIPEAHLYLSPLSEAGRGNHSYVYGAEWEIPRSVFVDDILCKQCVREDVQRILEAEDGQDGKNRAPEWDQNSGLVSSVTHHYEEVQMSIGKQAAGGGVTPTNEYYTLRPQQESEVKEYSGPLRYIHTSVQYQNLERGPYCSHMQDPVNNHPLTSRVRVIAKLSIPRDQHLKVEAQNYQNFPSHFFEHWTGFNVVHPLRDPTPVGTMVPQFYGYYVQDLDSGHSGEELTEEEAPQSQYLSPILLMEDCGSALDPDKFNIDDRNECAALYFRMTYAGWLHESVAPRNILHQSGPITAHPSMRNRKDFLGQKHTSFRLIDFGRSQKCGKAMHKAAQDALVVKMLRVLHESKFA